MFKAVQSLTDAVHVLLQSVPLPHDRKESIALLIGDVCAELSRIALATETQDVNQHALDLQLDPQLAGRWTKTAAKNLAKNIKFGVRSFEVTERPSDLGGGWKLVLFENDLEVGGGIFPHEDYVGALEQAAAFLVENLTAEA